VQAASGGGDLDVGALIVREKRASSLVGDAVLVEAGVQVDTADVVAEDEAEGRAGRARGLIRAPGRRISDGRPRTRACAHGPFVDVVDPAGEDGQLDYAAAEGIINEKTRIVAFTHVSNVTGAITDVPRLVSLARKHGALVVLDACQSVPHMPVDFHALDVDFAAFSGHKMLAPTGIGALYGRAELLNALPPFLTGGSMITRVGLQDAEYMPAPIKFEASTQRVSQAVAFAAAVRYLQHLGMENVEAWEHELGARLVEGVQKIEGVRLLGPADPSKRAGLVALAIEGVHPHDVGQLLDTQGIAVRVGHHCAQPLHRCAGVTASTRASTYIYNTTEDVDAFLKALAEVRPYFGL